MHSSASGTRTASASSRDTAALPLWFRENRRRRATNASLLAVLAVLAIVVTVEIWALMALRRPAGLYWVAGYRESTR